MSKLKYFLGFLWVLPASLIAWVILAFIWINHGIEDFYVDDRFIFVVDLNNNNWFYRVFFKRRRWLGWSLGNTVFVVDVFDPGLKSGWTDEEWNMITLHEAAHCIQQYKWGIFWYLAYAVDSIRVWFKHKSRHAYYDNRFEREARRLSGDVVDLSPEFWRDGPRDRWPWW